MLLDLISPERRPSVRNRGATLFEIQAALIPEQNRFPYQSAQELILAIQTIIDSRSAEECFIYFHGISDREYDTIEEELRKAQLQSSVRLTFENALDAAILRIMPRSEHHRVGINFFMEIRAKIASIHSHGGDSVHGFGATLLQIPGVRSKEGDQALGPATSPGWGAWPSLMIELGYSGGLDFLRLDAKWWLINSGGKTRFVILVQIMTNPFGLRFECWKMIPSGRRQTRQTRAWIPEHVQDFNIDEEGVVTSASQKLSIPYDCIFDEPSENASDVVFTNAELSSFALWMFNLLQ